MHINYSAQHPLTHARAARLPRQPGVAALISDDAFKDTDARSGSGNACCCRAQTDTGKQNGCHPLLLVVFFFFCKSSVDLYCFGFHSMRVDHEGYFQSWLLRPKRITGLSRLSRCPAVAFRNLAACFWLCVPIRPYTGYLRLALSRCPPPPSRHSKPPPNSLSQSLIELCVYLHLHSNPGSFAYCAAAPRTAPPAVQYRTKWGTQTHFTWGAC